MCRAVPRGTAPQNHRPAVRAPCPPAVAARSSPWRGRSGEQRARLLASWSVINTSPQELLMVFHSLPLRAPRFGLLRLQVSGWRTAQHSGRCVRPAHSKGNCAPGWGGPWHGSNVPVIPPEGPSRFLLRCLLLLRGAKAAEPLPAHATVHPEQRHFSRVPETASLSPGRAAGPCHHLLLQTRQVSVFPLGHSPRGGCSRFLSHSAAQTGSVTPWCCLSKLNPLALLSVIPTKN